MEPINQTFQQRPPKYVYKVFSKDSTENNGGRNLASLISGGRIEVALDDLYSNEYSLKEGRCIPMTLRYEYLSYIFIQDDLNLWGEEKTLQEAEEVMASAIVKLYKRLLELDHENKLGPYPKEQLDFLKEYIA